MGIIAALTDCLSDPRHPSYSIRAQQTLMVQRVYQIAFGYPDATDCETFPWDPVLQLADGLVSVRAGSTTASQQITSMGTGGGVCLNGLMRAVKAYLNSWLLRMEGQSTSSRHPWRRMQKIEGRRANKNRVMLHVSDFMNYSS